MLFSCRLRCSLRDLSGPMRSSLGEAWNAPHSITICYYASNRMRRHSMASLIADYENLRKDANSTTLDLLTFLAAICYEHFCHFLLLGPSSISEAWNAPHSIISTPFRLLRPSSISEAWNAPHSIILMECQTTCPTENNNWNNSIVSLSLSLNQSTNPPLAIAGYKYES